MQGLQSGIIRIGTFPAFLLTASSIIKDFKDLYPSVHFELKQGEYTQHCFMVKEGDVDFGFVNPNAVSGLTPISLKTDEMLAYSL